MTINRLTIVNDDNMVIVNDFTVTMPLDLPDNIHAVQWLNGKGEIEYNDGQQNELFTDISRFSDVIDGHARQKELLLMPYVPSEKEAYDHLVTSRESILYVTDWLVLRHLEQLSLNEPTTLSSSEYISIGKYRKALRDLPSQYKTSESWKWPSEPKVVKVILKKKGFEG